MLLLFEHKYFSLEHTVHLKYCKPLHKSVWSGSPFPRQIWHVGCEKTPEPIFFFFFFKISDSVDTNNEDPTNINVMRHSRPLLQKKKSS